MNASPRKRATWLGLCGLAIVAAGVLDCVPASFAQEQAAPPAPRVRRANPDNVTPTTAREVMPSTPVTQAQRVFFVGHSFHIFLARGRDGSPGPVMTLAKEAGYADHATAGMDMIGGSTPMQHWKRGTEDSNTVKVALRGRQVDVLTLAANALIPEQGIDNFADLAIQYNPNVRVLLQMSWGTFDGLGSAMIPADRDLMTAEDLAGMRESLELYKDRMRQQIKGINDRHGKEFVFIVPVHVGVLKLREEVLMGRVPGVARQTDLYADSLGHAKKPIMDLAAYMFYTAIYRKSPIGLTTIDDENTDVSKARHRVLQRIAWDTILGEPYSGVHLPLKKLPPRDAAASRGAAGTATAAAK